jgi:hypothetical protein
MYEDNFDYLEKFIEGSGHPVSLKISTILQRKGWYVKNAPRYSQKNSSGELREIDVVGTKKSKLYEDAFNDLIIECKKQKDPWIFFKQPQKNENKFTLNTNFAGYVEGYLDDSPESKHFFQRHYYYKAELCTYFIVGCKNPEKGGPGATIDRAINQVHNALKFYIAQGGGDNPVFFYPIIVFDGEIFEASYQNEKLVIKKSNHISLYFEIEYDEPELFHSAKTGSLDTILESKPYIIDIVKLSYFEKFLDKIEMKS